MLYIVLMFSSKLFETPFRWIGKTILGLNYDFNVSGFGSGDHTYAYITFFVNLVLAIILMAIWSFFGRNHKEYNKPLYWLIVVLRIFLIAAMLLYGFVKIFQIQFQPPSFSRLLQPLGEFSPMGLAWTYMGFSKGFGMFAGIMEIVGGILLIWRRTSTLGAFIVIGVMTQVAMMNLTFDIPVKLFSIHLVLMALVIFTTDIKRFLAVFLNNKATTAYKFFHPVNSKSYHKIIGNGKKILLPILLIAGCILGYLGQINISDINHRPTLYGIWEAKSFIKNNDTLAPLITDSGRWHYLLIEKKGRATTKSMTGSYTGFNTETDSINGKLKLYDAGIKLEDVDFNFRYTQPTTSELQLSGSLNDTLYNIVFKKKPHEEFTLINRGFHWINETPFNK